MCLYVRKAWLDSFVITEPDLAELLLSQSAPGQPYHDTLLIVMGDHGQTLGGDHGGASAEETDSVVVAFSMAKWWQARQDADRRQDTSCAPDEKSSLSTSKDALGQQDMEEHDASSFSPEGDVKQDQVPESDVGSCSPAHQKISQCLNMIASANTNHSGAPANHTIFQANSSSASRFDSGASTCQCPQNSCKTLSQAGSAAQDPPSLIHHPSVMHQLDWTATFALIMGIPVPYSNLGQLDLDWWHLAYRHETQPETLQADEVVGECDGSCDWLFGYLEALRMNAWQVSLFHCCLMMCDSELPIL